MAMRVGLVCCCVCFAIPMSCRAERGGTIPTSLASQQDVLAWCDGFLEPGLDATALAAAFRATSSRSRGEDLEIVPGPETNLERMTIEVLDGELVGMIAYLRAPITMDLRELRRRFGEPRTTTMGSPEYFRTTLSYQLPGNDAYVGQLLVEVPTGETASRLVIVRRFSLAPERFDRIPTTATAHPGAPVTALLPAGIVAWLDGQTWRIAASNPEFRSFEIAVRFDARSTEPTGWSRRPIEIGGERVEALFAPGGLRLQARRPSGGRACLIEATATERLAMPRVLGILGAMRFE
jgi:hypothetical protein